MSDLVFEFDPTLAEEGDKQAAEAFRKLNYGRLTMQSRFLKWENKQSTEVTPDIFKSLDPKARSQEAVVTVGVREFKPEFEREYVRKIAIGGPDWNRIFKPSIYAALGTTEKETPLADALKKLHGAYVCVEDVPQTLSKKDREAGRLVSEYNTAKVVTIYPDFESCKAAHAATYKSSAGGNGASASAAGAIAAPPGFTGKGEWTLDAQVGIIAVYQNAAESANAGSKADTPAKEIHKTALDVTITTQFGNVEEISMKDYKAWVACIEALLTREHIAF